MGKLFFKSLLLVFTIALIFVFIICYEYDKEFAYNYLKKDYNKAGWIYNKIFNDTTRIDLAFVGTSHSLNAINDSLVFLNLKKNKTSCNTTNLSLSHTGRNLHYVMIKDLLKNRKVKTVVLEIREKETRTGHFAFPILAEASDILIPVMIFNLTFIKDISMAFKSRIEYITTKFLQLENCYKYTDRQYGFYVNPHEISEKELKRRSKSENNKFFFLREKFFELEFNFGKKYVEKISTLTKEKQTELVFLYLPFFKTKYKKPYLFNFYSKMGKVIIPPKSILDNPENWSNLTHLNKKGSDLLSNWLSDELLKLEIINKKTGIKNSLKFQ